MAGAMNPPCARRWWIRRANPSSWVALPETPVSREIPRMAWFRKEKKPRQPQRERLEIPADAWEKCEACGHTDLRDKFVRNDNVCPSCDYHRRLRAAEYAQLLLDDGSWVVVL